MRKAMVGARLNQHLLNRVHDWAESRKITRSTAIEALVTLGLLLERLKARAKIQEWSDSEVEGAFLAFAGAVQKEPGLLRRWAAAAQQGSPSLQKT